jgi:DNA polymerase-3 subunit epsilon
MALQLAGVDIESTGLEVDKGDRIIEIAILTYDFASRALVDKYVQRIDPDRSISAKAQEVHGISYNELVGCPKWEDVAATVKSKLDDVQVAVAHNMSFDGPFIGTELLRLGYDLPRFEPFCTMENARWACPFGKYPSLEELCFALQVPYDRASAHAADYDVSVMMECFWRGLDRGFYRLPALESVVTP